jgi:hypothetical protein
VYEWIRRSVAWFCETFAAAARLSADGLIYREEETCFAQMMLTLSLFILAGMRLQVNNAGLTALFV